MNFNLDSYDLVANTPLRINVAGRQFLIVQAAGNIDAWAIRRNSRQGEILGAPQGIALKAAPNSAGFDGLEIQSDQTETVKIAIADDEIDLAAIASSVTIASPLGPNSAVEVEDTAGNSFADLLALTQLNDDENQRTPLTNLGGTSFGGRQYVGSGATTVISGAANTGGVIIRFASLDTDGTTDCRLRINGQNFIVLPSAGSQMWVRDIFVPASFSIDVYTGGAGGAGRVWYEAL